MSIIGDIIAARVAWEREHDQRVIEVHVSPRIEVDIAQSSEVVAIRLPLSGELDRSINVTGVDWFVDRSLSGEEYRFVAVPSRFATVSALSDTESSK